MNHLSTGARMAVIIVFFEDVNNYFGSLKCGKIAEMCPDGQTL